MTDTSFEISVDRENQVIVQRLYRALDEAMQQRLYDETERATQQLDDPDSVYILGVTTKGYKFSRNVRLKAREHMLDPRVKKVAMVVSGPLGRVMGVFLAIAAGEKVRMFPDEAAAMKWLMEGRHVRRPEEERS